MHVAALINRLRENLAQRCPQAGMIVGDDEFDAVQTTRPEPRRKSRQLDRLSRLASSNAATASSLTSAASPSANAGNR
jgi:hypothetical protein